MGFFSRTIMDNVLLCLCTQSLPYGGPSICYIANSPKAAKSALAFTILFTLLTFISY
jgi:hypothetical protein